jgi:choline dehydrogenase
MGADRVDTLVVGAGTAGCALAARLSEDPDRCVQLVEAGPDVPSGPGRPEVLRDSWRMPDGSHEWDVAASADGERAVHFPVGKLVGGTSLVGGAGAWRPRASDFEAWAALGLPEWGWDEVGPWFNAVEADGDFGDRPWHGTEGALPISRFPVDALLSPMRALVAAVTDAGHPFCEDLNAPDATGIGPNPLAVRGRERVSAADAYLTAEVRARPNLTLRANATVQRLALEGECAVGAVVDGELIRARETVLCAGVPFSPALMLRSGIGPAAELEAAGVTPVVDLDGVGRGLMDQPAVLLFAVPRDGARSEERSTAPAEEPFLQVAARLRGFPGAAEDHAFYVSLFNGMPVDAGLQPLIRAERSHWLIVSDLAPSSRGTIPRGGPEQRPVCNLRFYDQDSDLQRMRSGVLALWELAKHPALTEEIDRVALVTERMLADDLRLNGIVRSRTVSRQPWGGCAMGGVVDAVGRVHGVQALRVADTSIVPVPLRAGGVLTALVIGERIAAAIREAPSRSPDREEPVHAHY